MPRTEMDSKMDSKSEQKAQLDSDHANRSAWALTRRKLIGSGAAAVMATALPTPAASETASHDQERGTTGAEVWKPDWDAMADLIVRRSLRLEPGERRRSGCRAARESRYEPSCEHMMAPESSS